MSQYDVRKALLSHYENGAFSLPTAYENRDFEPGNNSLWCEVLVQPQESLNLMKDSDGIEDGEGDFQISLYALADSGTSTILSKADEILAHFKATTTITQGTTEVRVISTAQNTGRRLEKWFVIDLTISYRALMER